MTNLYWIIIWQIKFIKENLVVWKGPLGMTFKYSFDLIKKLADRIKFRQNF